MDFILFLLAILAIAALAPWFGSDSRDLTGNPGRDLTDSYPNRDRLRPL